MECARTGPPTDVEEPETVVLGPAAEVLGTLVAAGEEGRGEEAADTELLLGVPKLRAAYTHTHTTNKQQSKRIYNVHVYMCI